VSSISGEAGPWQGLQDAGSDCGHPDWSGGSLGDGNRRVRRSGELCSAVDSYRLGDCSGATELVGQRDRGVSGRHRDRIPSVTVTNDRQASQSLSSLTVSIRTESNGDAETVGGRDIRGCLASLFTISIDPGDRASRRGRSGGSYAGKVDVGMRDSGTNQDACRSGSPAITVPAV
jgi:hypothetical protein